LLTLFGALAFPAVGLGTVLGLRHVGVPSFPAYVLAQVTTLIFTCGIIRVTVGSGWAKALDVRLPGIADLALALAGWPAVSILIFGLQHLAVSWPPLLDLGWLDTALAVNPEGWPLWLVGAAFAVGPGITEELWYRGWLGWALARPPSVIRGILVCSVLFGLGHLRPVQVLASTVFGLYLHITYLSGRSLLLPVIVHLSQNGLGVLETMGVISLQPFYEMVAEHPIPIYLGAGLVLVVVVCVQLRRWNHFDKRSASAVGGDTRDESE
jgi:membrane protease YdiL (CAAX protease family)